MAVLFGIVSIFIVGALVLSMFAALLRRLNRWNRIYDEINKRYCGQLFRGYLFSAPKLWFNYGRTSVRVQNKRGFRYPRKKSTELALQWQDHRTLRFEIEDGVSASGSNDRARRWSPRLYRVLVGDSEFDNGFQVQSNAPDAMIGLLTNSVRWQLRQLVGHGKHHHIHVSLKRGTLRIVKPGWMSSAVELGDFVRFGLELFDRLVLAECEGIEFKNEDSVTLVENVTCPICSEKIVSQMVVCLRCKTPHCMDCWQYNGQCATFACEEKRYVKA